MPAFATFSRRAVGESSIFRSIRSNLRSWRLSSHHKSSAGGGDGGASKQKLGGSSDTGSSKATSPASTNLIGATTTITTTTSDNPLTSEAEGRYYKLDDLSSAHAEGKKGDGRGLGV